MKPVHGVRASPVLRISVRKRNIPCTSAERVRTVPYNNIAARQLGRRVRYMTADANQLGLCGPSNLSLE